MLDQLFLLKKKCLFSGKSLSEQSFGVPASDRRRMRTVRQMYHAFHVTTLAAKRTTLVDPYCLQPRLNPSEIDVLPSGEPRGSMGRSFGPLAGDACRAAPVFTPIAPIDPCNANCTARITNTGLRLVDRQNNA